MFKKLRTLVVVLSCFSVSALWADSRIFFTNSTPETVTIEVDHWSTAAPLTNGQQWQQKAFQLAPYETAEVLTFNRNVGVKRGKSYYFDTTIRGNSNTWILQQRMVGQWIGSRIEHSAKGIDWQGNWHNDRNLHRYTEQWQNTPAKLAFKAEFTGGYDDFYYTINVDPAAQLPSPNDALNVLTYNIYALPLIASDISVRLNELPNYLKGYDAILFQEAFSSDSPAMLRALREGYPYQTDILRKNFDGLNIYNGGVAIVSKHPIGATDYVVYPDCTGTDCFADKGFVYAELIKDGKAYHVVATHAASFDTDAARAMRQQQFKLMQQFIAQQQIPAFDAVIYGGDFNVNKLKFSDDYQRMLNHLRAEAPPVTGYTESTFDPRINYYASKYGTVEYLDYVVVSKEHRGVLNSENHISVPRSSSGSLFRKWDLSDHFPVQGVFLFQ